MRTVDRPLVPYRLGLSHGGGAETPAACARGGTPVADGDEATVDCGGGGSGSDGDTAVTGAATPAGGGSQTVRELDFAAQLQNGAPPGKGSPWMNHWIQ